MKLIEISAWNDSGGGFLNRLLDSHSAFAAWPTEFLLGNDTSRVDCFSPDWFHGRFRWPRLDMVTQQSGAALFDQISDHELKELLLKPLTAKHSQYPVSVDLFEWRAVVDAAWEQTQHKSQAEFIRVYVCSFYQLWHGAPPATGFRLLGHSPIAILDAPEIWADFPDARILHVVRNPLSGFFDMRSRHPELLPVEYAKKWALVNGFAAALCGKYPDRARMVYLEDLLIDRASEMRAISEWLGIRFFQTLLVPTWMGQEIDPHNMGPFGGVPCVDIETEHTKVNGLSSADQLAISTICDGTSSLLKAMTQNTQA